MFLTSKLQVDVPSVTFPQMLLPRLLACGDTMAVIEGHSGLGLTYKQFAHSCVELAAGLIREGLNADQAVVLYASNCMQYIQLLLAAPMAGGVLVTVPPQYDVDQLAHILENVDASILVVTPDEVDKAEIALSRCLGIQKMFVTEDVDGYSAFSTLLHPDESIKESRHIDNSEVSASSPMAILYGGSTVCGGPEGVVHSHATYTTAALQLSHLACAMMHAGDVTVSSLPFWHIYAQTILFVHVLYQGATIVIPRNGDFKSFLQTVAQYKVTFAAVGSNWAARLAEDSHVEPYNLSSLKTVVNTPDVTKPSLANHIQQKLHLTSYKHLFSLTELGIITSTTNNECLKDPACIGTLMPNLQAKIVSPESGADVGVLERGELCVRCSVMFLRYQHQPSHTAQVRNSQGLLPTGEVVYANDQGLLYYCGSLKDAVHYHGHIIFPTEIRNALSSHSSFEDVRIVVKKRRSLRYLSKLHISVTDETTSMAAVMQRQLTDKLSLDDPIPIEMLEFENVIDKKGSISNMTVKT